MLESCLSEQAPELKIGLSLLAAGFITSGALVLCWLTGSDPWGKLLPLTACFCAQACHRSKSGNQQNWFCWSVALHVWHHLLSLSGHHQPSYHFFIRHVHAVHMSLCNIFL